MAKTKISEYDALSANNTDVDSINIAEGCAPSGINNAIREVMAHLKDFQQGTNGDSFNGPVNGALNGTVGATTPAAGTFTTLRTTSTLGVGVAPSTSVGVYANSTSLTGTSQFGVAAYLTSQNTATAKTVALTAKASTAAGAYTTQYLQGLVVEDATKGAGSTIDGQHGLYIYDQTQGTSNYGITSLVSSDTNKWNIYASGTAKNYFAGNVGIGQSNPTYKLTVSADGGGSALAYFNNTNANAYGLLISSNDTDNTRYAIKATSGATTLFYVGNGGNVGIGTSSPTAKLDVSGTAAISGAVTLSGGTANGVAYLNGSKVVTSGSALTFDGTNLGIGTSSPSELLTVGAGTASANSVLYLNGGSDSATGAGIKLAKAGTAFGFIGSVSWLSGGTSNNLGFSANSSATNVMQLDSSGNLGLGVAPSAWGSIFRAQQIGSGNSFIAGRTDSVAGRQLQLGTNAYYNGTNWIYGVSQPAAKYYMNDGAHFWEVAPSGTAGNAISFTQAMTLNASGNLLVGATSSDGVGVSRFQLGSASSLTSGFLAKSTSSSISLYASSSSGSYQVWKTGTFMAFGEGPDNLGTFTERARIDSSGNFLIGSTSGSSRVDVTGSDRIIRVNSSTTNNNALIRFSDNGTAKYSAGWNPATGFIVYDDTASVYRMVIDSSGNLLVGTTSAAAKLDVVTGGIGGVAAAARIGASGNGGSGRGTKLTISAPGSSNAVDVVELIGYQNSASATANNAAFAINVANTSGTLTERARIDSSGNLLVGTTSASAGGSNYGTLVLAGGRLVTNRNVDGTDSVFQAFGNAGAAYIQGNGNLLNTNNSYGSLSDAKLKENVVDATPKLESLCKVRVVNYNLKNDPEHKQIGVIAQELEQIFPGMVEETPDRDTEDNDLGTTTKSVKYSVFVPMLVKAIQEQQAIIESLKARLDAANL